MNIYILLLCALSMINVGFAMDIEIEIDRPSTPVKARITEEEIRTKPDLQRELKEKYIACYWAPMNDNEIQNLLNNNNANISMEDLIVFASYINYK